MDKVQTRMCVPCCGQSHCSLAFDVSTVSISDEVSGLLKGVRDTSRLPLSSNGTSSPGLVSSASSTKVHITALVTISASLHPLIAVENLGQVFSFWLSPQPFENFSLTNLIGRNIFQTGAHLQSTLPYGEHLARTHCDSAFNDRFEVPGS